MTVSSIVHWLIMMTGFLERRKAPKHREHIQRLLERFGCDDLEGFLNVTHAVSLNDTFWVKKAESNLTWNLVSLYRNEFDQLISEAAFDGSANHIRQFNLCNKQKCTDTNRHNVGIPKYFL